MKENLMCGLVAISPEILLLFALLRKAALDQIKKGNNVMIFIIGIGIGILIAVVLLGLIDIMECVEYRKRRRNRKINKKLFDVFYIKTDGEECRARYYCIDKSQARRLFFSEIDKREKFKKIIEIKRVNT